MTFDLESIVRETLSGLTEEDTSTLRLDEDLGDAIGLDSLGRLELLSDIEEQFDLTIYDLDSDKASTLGGMIEIVSAALHEKEEAA